MNAHQMLAFNRLREIRAELGLDQHVPPYTIASDWLLRWLVQNPNGHCPDLASLHVRSQLIDLRNLVAVQNILKGLP